MRVTYPTALVLQALLDGVHHGFDIMDATGLPSGTVYPILRRLDADTVARREQRPPRRYYELSTGGRLFAGQAIAQVRRGLGASSGRLAPRVAED
jgi:PadR family transcriptional regulator